MKILIVGFVASATLEVTEGGVLIRYRHPKELDKGKDSDLFFTVEDMLEKEESLRVYIDQGHETLFVEIVDSQGDEIQIVTGKEYVENIIDIVQNKIDEGDIIIDIDSPETPILEEYYEDIFFLREQQEHRTKEYEDGSRLEVLEYFEKTHANIKLTKVRFIKV